MTKTKHDKHKDDDVYLVDNVNNSVGGEDVSCGDPGTVGHHHLVKMRRRIIRMKSNWNSLIYCKKNEVVHTFSGFVR